MDEEEEQRPAVGRPGWWLAIAAALCTLVTATMILKFRAGDFKDAEVWYVAGRRVLAGESLAELPHYRYPPTFAVLVSPLCAFGFGAFFFLWYGLNVVFFALSVRAAARLIGAWGAVARWRWIAVLLAAVFAVDNLFLGQTNILIMLLVYWSLLELERGRVHPPGREWLAGLPLGAAVSVKAFPAPLLAYFLYRLRLRAAAGTVLSCVFFLLVLPGPARGFRRNLAEVGDWGRRVVMPYVSGGQAAGDWGQHGLDLGNQSLAGVVSRYLTRVDAQVMARRARGARAIYVNIADVAPAQVNGIVLGLLGLLAAAFVAACGWRPPREAEERVVEYSLAIVLVLLASTLAWTYFFVMLLLPVMAGLMVLGKQERLRRSSVWMVRAAIWALAGAVLLLGNHYARALGSVCWAAVLLFAALALARRDLRRPRAQGEA